MPTTSQVKSIPEHFQLPEGSQLLIPNFALQPQQPKTQVKQDTGTKAALNLAQKLRHNILYKDNELLVLNKPPGLAVQGGPGITLSLDHIMQSALKFDSKDSPR